MTRYADPLACPDCTAALPAGTTRCPVCGLDLSDELAVELFTTLTRADALLERMRSRSAVGAMTAWKAPDAAAAETGTGASTGTTTDPFEPVPAGSGVPPAGSGVPPTGSGAPPVRDRQPPADRGLRPSAVPKILLTLGALCLLAAAIVFLVVTWSVLGVGGRTAVLVGFTLALAALTTWSAGRGFRGAVEALGLVSLGLLTLDLVGADSAGWFGDPSAEVVSLWIGAVLVVAGVTAGWAARRTPARLFLGSEIVAVLGGFVVVASAGALDRGGPVLPLSLALLVLGLATAVTLRLGVRLAGLGLGVVVAGGWVVLLAVAIEEASSDGRFTLTAQWKEGGAVGLVVTAGLAALVAVPPRVPQPLRSGAAAGGLVALTAALVLPALDNDIRWVMLTVMAVTLAGTAVVAAVPRGWVGAGLGVVALGVGALAVTGLSWAGAGLEVYQRTAVSGWDGTPGGRLVTPTADVWLEHSWLLPPAVLVLGVALGAALRRLPGGGVRGLDPRGGGGLLLGGAVTLSVLLAVLAYAVPVWLVLAALLLPAVAVGSRALDHDRPRAAGLALGLLALAQPLSWYDEVLTAATLTVTLVLTAVAHALARPEPVRVVAAPLAALSLGGLVWSLGAVLALSEEWVALVGTVLVALVGVLRSSLPGSPAERAALELGCAASAVPLVVLGAAYADRPATWTAVHLTVLGVAASALALLHPDRRPVAWLGGLLLAAATWLRLADVGVTDPEPYTLPSAVALLVFGLVQLHRRPALRSVPALGAGLSLALVPTLLWVLAENDELRALLLGLACLGLMLAGAAVRWSAPLLAGAVVGAAVVVREAAPYIGSTVPRWSVLAVAGTVLVVVALTWESRLADARRATGYVRRLR